MQNPTIQKPNEKPVNPNFSSGPTAKYPGWSLDVLKDGWYGRSHRAGGGKAKLKEVIDRHVALLGIPDDYYCAIVPASDTGAVEMAMWNLLGERGVDVVAWENFGLDWVTDATEQLKLDDLQVKTADYGVLPDFDAVDTDRDVVFTWNGTTSGVCVPDAEWIKDDRQGLTICDATSAVFAYDMPWDKLDVVTWSWQKVLGSEAAHGMIVLSPRAVERLENYTPPRAVPKLFRLTKKGKLNEGVFKGATINTPSMMATEDCLAALKWVESIGGLNAMIERSKKNLSALEKWVEQTPWVEFLAQEDATRSRTSLCLKITDPWFEGLDDDGRADVIGAMVKMLEAENVAYDIKAYRTAPAGLRIWGGGTVEADDIARLMPWVEWSYMSVKAGDKQAAA